MSNESKMQQVEIELAHRHEHQERVVQVVWLPVEDVRRAGDQYFRLKDDERWWKILRRFMIVHRCTLRTDWRVGGLE